MTAMPQSVKKLWNIWTLRGVVLLSLFFQIVLILLSPNRKRFSRKKFAFIIWVAYLLADITADYAVGLISSHQYSDLSDNDRDLLVLWSAFLIVHLGGPDTITALALEDNELWLRHLLMLIFQAGATLYVFSQSLPNNKLMIPMILMFISGCIKYLERTWSLYFAHGDRFPSARPNYRRLRDTNFESLGRSSRRQFDDLDLVKEAYRLFRFYRGQFFDLIYSFENCNGTDLFNSITATTALRLIEVELNFMYDILFTKAVVVHSFMGFFFRFFSFCCLIGSLAIFRFHITKHGVFNEINVAVTYVLFLGAIALEIIAFLMAVLSDWTLLAIIDSKESEGARADDPEGAQSEDQEEGAQSEDQEGSCDQIWSYWRRFVAQVSNFVEPTFGKIWSYWRKFVAQVSNFVEPTFGKIWSYWTPRWYPVEGAQPEDEELRTPLLFRRWSGCLSKHNLIRHCLKGQPSDIPIVNAMNWLIDQVGLRELLDQMTPLPREPLRKKLWNLIFEDLQNKSKFLDRQPDDVLNNAYEWVSAKGDWVFQDKSDLDGDLHNDLKKRYIGDLNEDLHNKLKIYIDNVDEDEDLRNNLKRFIDDLDEDLRNKRMRHIHDVSEDEYLLNKLKMYIDNVDEDEDLRNKLKTDIDFVDEDLRKKLKRDIDAPFDESLLVWHVATEILYNQYPANDVSKNNAEMSKILSDYMFYLLIMQPNLMAAVGALGQKRFQDTCEAAKKFFSRKDLRPSQQREACDCILKADYRSLYHDHESKELLRAARSLADKLQKLGDKKWDFIIQVWVELLCHAAVHGSGKAHAQQLSKGGELITFVWLLMSRFGIGKGLF